MIIPQPYAVILEIFIPLYFLVLSLVLLYYVRKIYKKTRRQRIALEAAEERSKVLSQKLHDDFVRDYGEDYWERTIEQLVKEAHSRRE